MSNHPDDQRQPGRIRLSTLTALLPIVVVALLAVVAVHRSKDAASNHRRHQAEQAYVRAAARTLLDELAATASRADDVEITRSWLDANLPERRFGTAWHIHLALDWREMLQSTVDGGSEAPMLIIDVERDPGQPTARAAVSCNGSFVDSIPHSRERDYSLILLPATNQNGDRW